MSVTITREIATKVRDLVDAGLVKGVGTPKAGQMCVEAAVCYALGLPHGDDPGCVSQPLRQLKIRLNDAVWSSDLARAAGLRRLAVAQLGSAGVLDDQAFVSRVVEVTIRRIAPIALRAAARHPAHAAALEAAAVRCELDGTREAALEAKRVARAAYDAADAAAYAADAYAAYAAAYDAADAADAAYAAADAAYAAGRRDAAARDRVLGQFAEWVVEILIDLKAPGCQYLDLVPVKAL